MNEDEIRQAVRETYARIATGGRPGESPATAEAPSCCGPTTSEAGSCCSPEAAVDMVNCCAPAQATDQASCCAPVDTSSATGSRGHDASADSRAIGYSDTQLGAIPEGANLGLGCGNPTALASLKEGEVVLDLGAGGGIDCFLAARAVGEKGRVIGVDMTPQMVSRARENATRGGYTNVDFRLGEIEHLPVADNTVDAIISNCVINLSPAKERVFGEAYRTLKPGGRVMVSDIVLTRELPEHILNSVAAYAGCVAGASMKEQYLATIDEAGFEDVEIVSEVALGLGELEGAISSVNVRAVKPS